VRELIQVTEGEKAGVYLLADLPVPAGTDLQSAEIGMPYRKILAQVAQAQAVRAARIAG